MILAMILASSFGFVAGAPPRRDAAFSQGIALDNATPFQL
jgi:hypothetical protein